MARLAFVVGDEDKAGGFGVGGDPEVITSNHLATGFEGGTDECLTWSALGHNVSPTLVGASGQRPILKVNHRQNAVSPHHPQGLR